MSTVTVAGMSLADIFLFARLTGQNPLETAEALAPKPSGSCADFFCDTPASECTEHDAAGLLAGSAPRLKAVASC